MDYEKEIPFGAFDSELMYQEIYIPEGFEATIKGNRIILKKTESKDEMIRKAIIESLPKYGYLPQTSIKVEDALAWLEKQDEQKPFDYESANIQQKDFAQQQEWSEEDERAIAIIKIALEHPYDMEGKWDRKFALDWLKLLKDRMKEKEEKK